MDGWRWLWTAGDGDGLLDMVLDGWKLLWMVKDRWRWLWIAMDGLR